MAQEPEQRFQLKNTFSRIPGAPGNAVEKLGGERPERYQVIRDGDRGADQETDNQVGAGIGREPEF